ncbi:MAG: SsrA-binding protein SmpB [Lachnospiraceae bacterium]|nr:SsrA-binding protein SmpB [Lachnospiraceae bacterium]
MAGHEAGEKLVANNKKAYHDYFIEEQIEAGIELFGTEVKSIRQGKCSIKESYVQIKDNEALILGMNVSPYEKGNLFNRDPLRVRRLLLHKREIRRLFQQIQTEGYTLVPLRVYLKRGLVKLEIGLAKGKKLYDKRAVIAKKDQARSAEREYKVKLR